MEKFTKKTRLVDTNFNHSLVFKTHFYIINIHTKDDFVKLNITVLLILITMCFLLDLHPLQECFLDELLFSSINPELS